MNTRNVRLLTLLALSGGALRSAYAASPDSPWTISIYGGDAVAVTGSLRSPTSVPLSDLGTLDPALTGNSGSLSLDKLRYDDLFRHRYDTGLELGYSLSDNLQTFSRFSYDGLAGRSRRIGTLASDGLTAPAPLDARFADADNMSLDIGSRYYWSTSSTWRPYASVALGATHLDAMRATLTVPDTAVDPKNVRFTRPGTVFSQSLETGVEFNPSTSFGMRLSVDADHFGTPRSAHDPALAEIGFDSAHDAQGRWAFPVAIAATYHFE
jgi:hypothetical protein